MAQNIDEAVREGRWDELTDEEIEWLHSYDRVPHEIVQQRGLSLYPGQDFELAKALQDLPYEGTANTAQRPASNPVPEEDLQPRKENLTKPQLRGEDEEDDEVDEDDDTVEIPDDTDYEGDHWTNDMRRAELADRGLSVEGNKRQLVSRLRQSDAERAGQEPTE